MKWFAIIFLSFLSLKGWTQIDPPKKEIIDNVQFWTSINSTTRLSNRWGVMGDFHIRRSEFIQNPNFYFLRLGAVYWGSDQLTLAGGIAHLWLANNFEGQYEFAGEKRIYQQVQWREKLNNFSFLFRIRNEQRWHEVLDENAKVDRVRFSNRVRFLFSTSYKLFKNDNLPKLVLADEMHIHFGKEIIYNTFDQNRLFLGLNQRINKTLSFDLGYMMVYQQKYSGFQYDLNHTIRWFFYYTPDLRKNKKEGIDHYPILGDE